METATLTPSPPIAKPAIKKKARTCLFYGDTGASKTTQLYFMAKWYIANNPGKQVRLITADGGGYAPFIDSGMIERGEVAVCDISNADRAYSMVNLLSEGYWPDDKGNIQKSKEFRRLKNIGMYLVEGLTSISNLWLGHLAHSPEGQTGFKLAYSYEEDGYEVGGLQPGHFGMVQGEISRILNFGFKTLPVDWVIWSALVSKGENRQKETVYGPMGAGTAQTAFLPTLFMDCIHIDSVTEGGKASKRAWIVNHADRHTEIEYMTRVACMPELIPELQKKYPEGYVKLGVKRGMDRFYEVLRGLSGGEGQTEGAG